MPDTNQTPSPTAFNGRIAGSGRFAAGNKIATGNPFAGRMALLKSALLNAITPEDVAEIAKAMVERAKTGDSKSVKLLLEFAIGKPFVVDVGQLPRPGSDLPPSLTTEALAGPVTPASLEDRKAALIARINGLTRSNMEETT